MDGKSSAVAGKLFQILTMRIFTAVP